MKRKLRVLVLCKRFPQGRDLLTRPYGRFYHLSRALAEAGHAVHVALLGYRRLPSTNTVFDGVDWSSDDLLPWGPWAYWRRIEALCRAQRPDWIVGFSDTWFGILAAHFARRHGARVLVDAYDNFEAYMPWAQPLHRAWRRAVRQADLVTAAGPDLAARLSAHGAARCEIVPMAADPGFRPLSREACRRELGLPADRRLLGHLGAFDASRGHEVLLRAVDALRARHPDLTLVLSGRHGRACHQPPAILGLDYLPDAAMPALVNSLDVACVMLADNAFGHYSYPAKLCEAQACGVPVVASDTGPTRWMLRGDARFLAALGEVDALAARIEAALALGRVDYPEVPDWSQVGTDFVRLLEQATAPAPRQPGG